MYVNGELNYLSLLLVCFLFFIFISFFKVFLLQIVPVCCKDQFSYYRNFLIKPQSFRKHLIQHLLMIVKNGFTFFILYPSITAKNHSTFYAVYLLLCPVQGKI